MRCPARLARMEQMAVPGSILITAETLGLAEGFERGVEAWALRLLAEVSGHSDPPEPAAEDRYREALTLASELDMRPLVAHCHLGLGTLYRKTGWREQAREHLTTATAMYRQLDMRFWLEKAEAETAGLA